MPSYPIYIVLFLVGIVSCSEKTGDLSKTTNIGTTEDVRTNEKLQERVEKLEALARKYNKLLELKEEKLRRLEKKLKAPCNKRR